MTRSISKLVGASLLLLFAMNPQPHRVSESLPIPSRGTPVVRWDELQTALERQADWYRWASQQKPPTPAVRKPATVAPSGSDGDVWWALSGCESGHNAAANTGNGFEGAFQFSPPTWRSMDTGYEHAYDAPYEVQRDAAERLQQRSGWGQWPACSRKLGLR